MSVKQGGQVVLSAAVHYISNNLPTGVLPYTIIVIGTIWICLIGILVRLTLGTSARRPKKLFHPSQRSSFEEPSS